MMVYTRTVYFTLLFEVFVKPDQFIMNSVSFTLVIKTTSHFIPLDLFLTLFCVHPLTSIVDANYLRLSLLFVNPFNYFNVDAGPVELEIFLYCVSVFLYLFLLFFGPSNCCFRFSLLLYSGFY